MRELYLECRSGVSGDMLVGAFLALGVRETDLRRQLERLRLGGYEIKISKIKKADHDAIDFDVILPEDNHDHDVQYLYGNISESTKGSVADTKEEPPHSHRTYKEVQTIIRTSMMSLEIKQRALDIFEVLAKAESKAHNVRIDDVRFHEIGAIDSIVDIVSIAICLEFLNYDEIVTSTVWEGCGQVRCQHGILDVPVPAVKNIVEEYNIPMEQVDRQGEYVTPTGIAVLAACGDKYGKPLKGTILKEGYGNGKRKQEGTGLLKAVLVER